jgi:mRNA-degrading endonuclease toxin of MazEF toxin-antitoxin module
MNGLKNVSAADALQIRSVDVVRFQEKIGSLPSTILEEIGVAVALVIELQ